MESVQVRLICQHGFTIMHTVLVSISIKCRTGARGKGERVVGGGKNSPSLNLEPVVKHIIPPDLVLITHTYTLAHAINYTGGDPPIHHLSTRLI